MAADLIRYDLLTQQALRDVVRTVLADAAKKGLPGEHHFYISFDTHAEGVKLSQRLRAQYPDEMTIILQHQFWDLTVTDERFEIGLSFNGIPERLVVPFASIKGFFDPSVQFGLQFEETESTDAAKDQPGKPATNANKTDADKPRRIAPTAERLSNAGPVPTPANPAPAPTANADEKPSGGAEVVRLDRFRKK
jgi:uncharacterized protein